MRLSDGSIHNAGDCFLPRNDGEGEGVGCNMNVLA